MRNRRGLPRVPVENVHQFTKAVLAAKSDLGEKLLLWKEQSAWVNRFVMVRYIKKLCERLGSDLTDRCVFLLMDMASPHIHADVKACCTAPSLNPNVRILVTASSLKGHAGKKATDRSKLDTRFFT